MSKQVLSIEQMQHLKDLGVDTSKASAYWYRIIQNKGDGNIRVISDWKLTFSLDIAYCTGHTLESVRSFTLQDILDLLPSEIQKDGKWSTLDILKHPQNYIMCFWSGEPLSRFENSILIDAAYEMLCWCAENGYLTTNKKNE